MEEMSRLEYQTGLPQTLCPEWIAVWLLKSVVRAGGLRKLQGQPSSKSPVNADKLPIALDGFKVKMSWFLKFQKVDLRLERRDDLQMKSMVKGSSKPQIPVSIQHSLLAVCFMDHLVTQRLFGPLPPQSHYWCHFVPEVLTHHVCAVCSETCRRRQDHLGPATHRSKLTAWCWEPGSSRGVNAQNR